MRKQHLVMQLHVLPDLHVASICTHTVAWPQPAACDPIVNLVMAPCPTAAFMIGTGCFVKEHQAANDATTAEDSGRCGVDMFPV